MINPNLNILESKARFRHFCIGWLQNTAQTRHLTENGGLIFLTVRDFSVILRSLPGKNGFYQLARSKDGQTCPKNPINATCFP